MSKRLFTFNCTYYLLTFILILPLITLRDYTPLNELRYLSIADDALKNGNFFSFYNHGEIYADKPPLYFWIIMLGKTIFGSHQIWFLSLFSILPAFIIQYIMDKWTKSELSEKYQLSAKLLLFTSAIFLAAALIVRMDMLMCMFITLSLYTFYKIYSGKEKKYDKYMLPIYIFMAIFSKGPVGVIIPIVSIISFLVIKGKIRDIGKYLGYRTLGILLTLCCIWFLLVWLEAGSEYLNNLLFHQTVNRAVKSYHHREPIYYYLKVFWYSFAPWSIIFFTLFILGIKNKLIKTDTEKLFMTVISSSFLSLSIVSSKIEIYMLPIFPFLVYLSVIILKRLGNKKMISSVLLILSIILALVLPSFLIGKNYFKISLLEELQSIIIIAISMLSIFSIISIYYIISRKNITASINCISLSILTIIFIMAFKLPSLNSYIGYKNMCKAGLEVPHEPKQYITYGIKRPENMNVFLNQSVTMVDKADILSGSYSGHILFTSKKALRKAKKLKEFIKDKNTVTVGNKLVIIL